MSLMRLLAAGRSLIGGNRQPAPYKLPEQNWLPKFGPIPKPGATPPAPKSDRVIPVAEPHAGESEKEPVAIKFAPVSSHSEKPNSILRNVILARSSVKKVLPLVQPELSLDAIEVVRNDLADADVEVVRKSSKPNVLGKAAPNPFAKGKTPAEQRWTEVAARLFHASRPGA